MKLQPYNLFIEKVVLCSILLNTVNLNEIFSKVKKEFFYLESHQVIFELLLDIYKVEGNINYKKISDSLLGANDIYLLDFYEILSLSKQLFISFYIDDYILLLVDKYIRRSIINLSFNLITAAQDNNIDLQSLLNLATLEMSKLILSRKRNHISSVASIYNDINISDNLSSEKGLLSGFAELDILTQGFQKSDLIIIAGRPSMGKTAFALNIANNVASSYKKQVLIFSLEMSKKQIFFRLLSLKSLISTLRLKNRHLSQNQIIRINEALQDISSIFIDDSANLSSDDLLNFIENSGLDNLGLIIIDYLQLMYINSNLLSSRNYNRVQELSTITRELKKIARKLQLPIILVSQVNRALEYRIDKRPLLSDLKDSGCLSYRVLLEVPGLFSNIIGKKLIFLNYYSQLISYYCLLYKENNIKKFKLNLINKVFYTGYKSFYSFNYYGNSFIELTANHKILISYIWLRLDNIVEEFNLFIVNSLKFYLQYFSSSLYYSDFSISYKQTTNRIYFLGFLSAFDLTMFKANNFLSGKIFLHNSIEQDADLVLMLYRDSYYNKTTDLLDETEIIITKQRNGPLGIIRLSFDPNYMQFKDI
jgi:replicative DNA helicase